MINYFNTKPIISYIIKKFAKSENMSGKYNKHNGKNELSKRDREKSKNKFSQKKSGQNQQNKLAFDDFNSENVSMSMDRACITFENYVPGFSDAFEGVQHKTITKMH